MSSWFHSDENVWPLRRYRYNCLSSTQEKACDLIDLGAEEDLEKGFLVTAQQQTRGVGQRGCLWHSRPGGIYMTLCLPWPESYSCQTIHCAQVVGLSVMEVLKICGLQAQVKWVNDVLLNGKKVAGTLCEVYRPLETRQFLLMGLGVNVTNIQKGDVFDQPVTSLDLESNRSWELEALIEEITKRVILNFRKLLRDGFEKSFESLLNCCLAFKGKDVFLMLPSGQVEPGILRGVTSQGHLILEQNGQLMHFSSGRLSV